MPDIPADYIRLYPKVGPALPRAWLLLPTLFLNPNPSPPV